MDTVLSAHPSPLAPLLLVRELTVLLGFCTGSIVKGIVSLTILSMVFGRIIIIYMFIILLLCCGCRFFAVIYFSISTNVR